MSSSSIQGVSGASSSYLSRSEVARHMAEDPNWQAGHEQRVRSGTVGSSTNQPDAAGIQNEYLKGLYAAQDPDGWSGTSSETSPSPDDIAEEARKGEVQRIASNNPAETRARTAWYGQLHANADGNPADNLAEEAKKGEYINKLYG